MSSRDLIFTSLTRRPSLVTGSHSLSSALPPRTPRPLTRPRPRPGPLPQTHCRSLCGSQRGLPLQGPRGLRALPQDWRHPPFGVLMKKKRSITFKNHESLYHTPVTYIMLYSNYQFSRSVVCDSLRPHELQHPRLHPDSEYIKV